MGSRARPYIVSRRIFLRGVAAAVIARPPSRVAVPLAFPGIVAVVVFAPTASCPASPMGAVKG